MKRVLCYALAVMLGGVIVQSADAASFSFTFGDNSFFWGDRLPANTPDDPYTGDPTTTADSWRNGQAADYPGTPYETHDDYQDEIGGPHIQGDPGTPIGTSVGGGSFVLDTDTGYLKQVNISYTMEGVDQEFFDLLQVGDLFIDDANLNGSDTWEWVAQSEEALGPVGVDVHQYAGGIAMGSHDNQPVDGSGDPIYTLSGTDDDGHWEGWLIRDDHPWKLESYNAAVGTAQFGGWEFTTGQLLTLSWDFTNGGLADGLLLTAANGGWDLGLGFTFNCGNDVLYEFTGTSESQGTPVPTPEPATLLLLASGFVGMGLKRARRSS